MNVLLLLIGQVS